MLKEETFHAKFRKDEGSALYHNNRSNKSKPANSKAEIECWNCGKKGHFQNECRGKGRKPQRKNGKEANVATKKIKSVAFMADSANSKISQKSKDDYSWYADSGASDHITAHKEWFDTYEELQLKESPIRIGDDRILYAAGRGDIEMESVVNGETIHITFKKVLHVPEIRKNLFSTGTAADAGVETRLIKDRCIMLVDNEIVMEGERQDKRLYRLNVRRLT